jgi:hypothetical protein
LSSIAKTNVRIGGEVDSSLDAAVSKASSSLGSLAVKIGSLVGGTAAVAWALKLTNDVESAAIGFETLIGSVGEASKMVEALQGLAADGPIDFNPLASAAQQLMAFGYEAEKIPELLRIIGDGAVATGKPAEEALLGIVAVLDRLHDTTNVTAKDMRAVTSVGVPAWRYMAEELTKTHGRLISVAEAQQLVAAGAVSGADAVRGLLAGMDKHSGGMMKRLDSETWSGLFGNLIGAAERTAIKISQALERGFNLKSGVSSVADWADSWEHSILQGMHEIARGFVIIGSYIEIGMKMPLLAVQNIFQNFMDLVSTVGAEVGLMSRETAQQWADAATASKAAMKDLASGKSVEQNLAGVDAFFARMKARQSDVVKDVQSALPAKITITNDKLEGPGQVVAAGMGEDGKKWFRHEISDPAEIQKWMDAKAAMAKASDQADALGKGLVDMMAKVAEEHEKQAAKLAEDIHEASKPMAQRFREELEALGGIKSRLSPEEFLKGQSAIVKRFRGMLPDREEYRPNDAIFKGSQEAQRLTDSYRFKDRTEDILKRLEDLDKQAVEEAKRTNELLQKNPVTVYNGE